MEKRLIATLVAAAFAGTAGMAVASPISVTGAIQYSVEAVLGASTGVGVSLRLGSVAYTIDNPIAANSNQAVRYQLSAKMGTCPALTVFNLAGGSIGPFPGIVGATAATNNQCNYTVVVGPTAMAAKSTLSFDNTGIADKTAGTTLAGGSLTTVVSLRDAAGTVTEQSSTATVATAAESFSGVWTASSVTGTAGAGAPFTTATKTETSKVDVAANPVSSSFVSAAADVTGTSTTQINLGAFQLFQNTGTFKDVDGATDVTIAALLTNVWKMTVTGPFAANTAPTGQVFASKLATCGTNDGNFTMTANTATLDFDAKTAALPTTSPQTIYVCYEPNVGGKTNVIPTGQFVGNVTTVAKTAPSPDMAGEVLSGKDLYLLGSNGAQIDLRVMTTSGTTGWSTVVRVINTGSSAVQVRGTYLNTDGTVGASGTIISSLPAGATAMLSAAQIEAALGVTLASTGNPPRLRISAPTDSLRAQAWIQSPNGAWFMGTPAQGSEAAGGGDPK